MEPTHDLQLLETSCDCSTRRTAAVSDYQRVPSFQTVEALSLRVYEAVRDLAIDARIFGYPLVTMEMTRRVMTNAAKPEGLRGPLAQFVNAREDPDRWPSKMLPPQEIPTRSGVRRPRPLQGAGEPACTRRARPLLSDAASRTCGSMRRRSWPCAPPADVRAADFGDRPASVGMGNCCWALKRFAQVPTWSGSLRVPTAPRHRRRRLCRGARYPGPDAHFTSAWGRPYTAPQGKVDPDVDIKKNRPREQST